jgi:mRNA interferase MazF
LKRGDVVLVAAGKPRPAVIVQADVFPTPVEILICPFTTTILQAPLYRLTVLATSGNGLHNDSQLMVDKLGPVRRDFIDKVVGRLGAEDLTRLTEAMTLLLGLAD